MDENKDTRTTPAAAEQLKPCPFCGKLPTNQACVGYTDQTDTRGMCENCGAQGPSATFGEHWKAWNRRAHEETGDAGRPPAVIYLQYHGDGPPDNGPVNDRDVTWCRDKIFNSDLRYVAAQEKPHTSAAGEWTWTLVPQKSNNGLCDVYAGREIIAIDLPYRDAESLRTRHNASLAALREQLEQQARLSETLTIGIDVEARKVIDLRRQLASALAALKQKDEEARFILDLPREVGFDEIERVPSTAVIAAQRILAIQPDSSALREQLEQQAVETRRWQDEYERATTGWENTKALCDHLSEQLASALAALKQKDEAMRTYGQHKLECQRYHAQMNAKPDVCDCGFDAALALRPDSSALNAVTEAEKIEVSLDAEAARVLEKAARQYANSRDTASPHGARENAVAIDLAEHLAAASKDLGNATLNAGEQSRAVTGNAQEEATT